MQFYENAMRRFIPDDEEKQKNYFEIAATLILLIVLVIMIYPAINHILQLQQEVTAGQGVNKALTQKLQDLATAQQNLVNASSDLPLANLALPVGTDFKNYLKTPLEKLAGNHQLTIKNIQFTDVPISSPGEKTLRLRQMQYTLTLTGNFIDFNAFLTDLETFIRTTQITNLEIKKADTAATPTITLTAETNYLGLPITVPQSGGAQ